MNVFVVWQIDHIGGLIVSSLLSDNGVELRRTSQDLNKASSVIKAWAIGNGGGAVLELVTLGAVEVPADKMTELPEVRRRFEFATDRKLTVGVGMDLPEAYKAMQFASSSGGDQIALYTQDMEQAIDADEVAKSLAKAQEDSQTPAEESSPQQAPEESQLPPAEASPPPAAGPAPAGDQQSAGGQPEAGDQSQDPRQAIVQALQDVKANADAIEDLKNKNPQAYEAIHAVVQAMILMAQGMMGDDVQKSERPDQDGIAPPTFSKEAMDALMTKHGADAYKIAWAAHNKAEAKKAELESEGLEKDTLPMPATTPKKGHMHYPDAPAAIGSTAGTVNDGKIKTAGVDPQSGAADQQKWHSERSGMVMGPHGAAVSSREPKVT